MRLSSSASRGSSDQCMGRGGLCTRGAPDQARAAVTARARAYRTVPAGSSQRGEASLEVEDSGALTGGEGRSGAR